MGGSCPSPFPLFLFLPAGSRAYSLVRYSYLAAPAPRALPSGVVKTLAYLIGSTIGGAIGWWIGAKFGTMSAYMLSTLLGGVGMYYAHKWSKEHLG